MFVYNIKLNGKSITKISLIIIGIIIVLFFVFSTYKILSESFKVRDTVVAPEVQTLTTESYTNVLKSVHDNLDDYVGKKIRFSGYVHRLSDFEDNDFVLARDMLINSNTQSLIVGFLCNSSNAKDFADGTWVELTGTISKGEYHGEIPVIKVTAVKQIDKPQTIYVLPPEDSYVPTSIVF